jgi:hypothetical protein
LDGNIAGDTDGGAATGRVDGGICEACGVWRREASREGTIEAAGVIGGSQASEGE